MKHAQLLERTVVLWRQPRPRWRHWLRWCADVAASPWRHHELTRTDDPDKLKLREHEFRTTAREYAPLRYFI